MKTTIKHLRSIITEESAAGDTITVTTPAHYDWQNQEDGDNYGVKVVPNPDGTFAVSGDYDQIRIYLDDLTIGDNDSQLDIWSTSQPPCDPPSELESDEEDEDDL